MLFGVRFIFCMKTTVPKSGLERGVVFGVRFSFCMKTTALGCPDITALVDWV